MDDILLNMLVNSEKNLINFQNLLDVYVLNPNNFVSYIGAGINYPIRDLPDWKELFELLNKKYTLNIKPSEEGKITPKDFTEIYSKINNPEEFDKLVIDLVVPNGTDSLGISWQLSRVFNKFITTNYFEPVEEAYKSCHIKNNKKLIRYNFLTDLNEISSKPLDDSILYLHGNLNSGFIILRDADYRFFYPSNHDKFAGTFILEKKLEFYLDNFNLLFIGINFEDDLSTFLYNYKLSKLKSGIDKLNDHYWLKDSSNFVDKFRKLNIGNKEIISQSDSYILTRNDFKTFLEYEIDNIYTEYNLKIIIYKHDHKFNGRLFDQLFYIKPNPEQPNIGSFEP